MRRLAVPLALGLAAALIAGPRPEAHAQLVHVRLTGQVDSNVGIDRMTTGDKVSEVLTWGSRYSPNLDGFIWHPRFLTFSAGGSFADATTEAPEGTTEARHVDPYRVYLTLFPESSHSFTVRAARSISETDFSGETTDFMTSTTTESYALGWRYRGDDVWPETWVEVGRQAVTTEGPGLSGEEIRTSLRLGLRKPLPRATPTLRYTLEHFEMTGDLSSSDGDGLEHGVQYEDRIRVGEQWYLTPSAEYRVTPRARAASAIVALAGPLSPTVDATSAFRYSMFETAGLLTQTASLEGALTKRVTPDLTVTAGGNGGVVLGDELTWVAGGFGGISATPFPTLRTAADYGVQLTGNEGGIATTNRAHVGAVSAFFPGHTLSADYHVNVFDRPESADLFVSQSVALAATSLVVPLTRLDLTLGLERQDGDGQQTVEALRLMATVTPVPLVALRGAVELAARSTRGGGRSSTDEKAWAVEAGLDVSPQPWLVLSATGRHGVRTVRQEDKDGDFASDSARGSATLALGRLQLAAEGFFEREAVVDQTRVGARALLGFRFRIWTITLEVERSSITSDHVDIGRERLMFRLTRPLDFTWP